MIDLAKRRQLGDSVQEYLEALPFDIGGDGEALWRIVPAGRYFGFSESDLDEFVGLCVRRLLDAGAVPVTHSDIGDMEWAEQTQLGTTNDEIVEGVIADWHKNYGGKDVPVWEGMWFVTRDVLEKAKRPPK